jgi:hypothetical protein
VTRIQLMILVVGSLCAANAQADEETWRCKSGVYWNDNAPVLVVATHGNGNTGEITVAGTTQSAFFAVDGFNRRWDFGPVLRQGLQYAFVIQPDGDAGYIDFSQADANGNAEPSQVYNCRLSAKPTAATPTAVPPVVLPTTVPPLTR